MKIIHTLISAESTYVYIIMYISVWDMICGVKSLLRKYLDPASGSNHSCPISTSWEGIYSTPRHPTSVNFQTTGMFFFVFLHILFMVKYANPCKNIHFSCQKLQFPPWNLPFFMVKHPDFLKKTGLDRSSLRRKTPHLAKLQRSDGDIPFNGFQSLVQLRILNGWYP